MKYRRSQHKKNIGDNNLFITIISLILVLILSLFISSNIANLIYKGSVDIKFEQLKDLESPKTLMDTEDNNSSLNYNETSLMEYANNIPQDNIIIFQGGVFNNLENAEEFRDKIENETFVSIVNDGKYERVILGVSTKDTFLDMVKLFKKNNIQFVKQVYEIPLNINYNKEILEIIGLFSNFMVDSMGKLSGDTLDTVSLKEGVDKIKLSNDKKGSYKIFNDLRDLILELDDESNRDDLESIIDFVYSNFKDYKV